MCIRDRDKTTIARHYLIYSETGDLDAGYVGDPFTESGAGCFPSTIVKTAERYLEEQKSDLAAVDSVSYTHLDVYKRQICMVPES